MISRSFISGILGVLLLFNLASADSPGDTVGTTWYDYQSNLLMGSRIVVDAFGGKHLTWMNCSG